MSIFGLVFVLLPGRCFLLFLQHISRGVDMLQEKQKTCSVFLSSYILTHFGVIIQL